MNGTQSAVERAPASSPARAPLSYRKKASDMRLLAGENATGIEGPMGLGITFAVWCMRKRQAVTRASIEKRFGVSRSTAYRWLRAWLDAVEQGIV